MKKTFLFSLLAVVFCSFISTDLIAQKQKKGSINFKVQIPKHKQEIFNSFEGLMVVDGTLYSEHGYGFYVNKKDEVHYTNAPEAGMVEVQYARTITKTIPGTKIMVRYSCDCESGSNSESTCDVAFNPQTGDPGCTGSICCKLTVLVSDPERGITETSAP